MSYTNTILITGGTLGLGLNTAFLLAKQNPTYLIVIASRSDKNSVAATINTSLKQQNVQFLPLDLSSLSNVRTFAKNWSSKSYPPIISLLLNAALQFPNGVSMSTDNIESTFAITHVGHALLFHLLTPYLADHARVVVTSSGTHDPAVKSGLPDAYYNSAEELAHPTVESAKNEGRQRYATSKLANVLWTYALHRRLEKTQSGLKDKHITVNAFDPGLMPGTGLAREASAIMRFLWNHILPHIIPLLRLVIGSPNIRTAKESSENLARMATGKRLEGVSGVYYSGTEPEPSSVDSHDQAKQDDLWEWTVKTVAVDEEERLDFEI